MNETKKERENNFNKLAKSTQEILLIIYKTKDNYVNTDKVHPIDPILVYSYDQGGILFNNTQNAALLMGITLPLSPNQDVIFREIVTRYLKFEAEGKFSLREIIAISPHEYAKTEMYKYATFGRRTDKFVEEYFETLGTKSSS
ncbi:MAG: hypothetical protein Solumvirus1_39 [Solumvirus sp.]|uniref:Uncharacterized protein n=1 Tax=Solumvirus sp. TaxID=2487773 RepID=A0A3G5AHU7_9VIRU|nr:MAG: hypothetical protein Solumvirus1_39 [Solumvirus sp.]